MMIACGEADDDRTGVGGRDGQGGGGQFGNAGDPLGTGGGVNGGGVIGGGTGGYTDPNAWAGCTPEDATLWFVVDGSGSMEDDLGGERRWDALRSALLDADGAIPRLESIVHMGLVIYDGAIDWTSIFGAPMADVCPRLVTVPAAPMNYGPIDQAYDVDPLGGSTPTHQALEATRAAIAAETSRPDAAPRAHYIVLATDGAPNDTCRDLLSGSAEPLVIEQVQLALQEGVQTFVINLGADQQDLTAHLNEVANAGGTGTAPFVPTDKDALVGALRSIVSDAVGCDILAPQ